MSDPRRDNDDALPPEMDTAPSGEMVPAEQVKAALEAAQDFKDKLLRTWKTCASAPSAKSPTRGNTA